ncbi:hypothetical protein Enr13x_02830 [Stieleria neptunia]|uniref:Uncharacterized protein n=1 Tax=Stieleria neptunia TaxID=2527979 RepID=A0A518HI16_9BACT|nr:hypothetical protein [Stieleria neptunia]QDV40477.1 hypothetical protein Enr13x_02830 [Stieleria neptunia]
MKNLFHLAILSVFVVSCMTAVGCSDSRPTVIVPEMTDEELQQKAEKKAAEVEGQIPT